MAVLRKLPLEQGARQKLEGAVIADLAAFPDLNPRAGAAKGASASPAVGYRVRCRSFLLTYN